MTLVMGGLAMTATQVSCLDPVRVSTRAGEVKARNTDWIISETINGDTIVVSDGLFQQVFRGAAEDV